MRIITIEKKAAERWGERLEPKTVKASWQANIECEACDGTGLADPLEREALASGAPLSPVIGLCRECVRATRWVEMNEALGIPIPKEGRPVCDRCHLPASWHSIKLGRSKGSPVIKVYCPEITIGSEKEPGPDESRGLSLITYGAVPGVKKGDSLAIGDSAFYSEARECAMAITGKEAPIWDRQPKAWRKSESEIRAQDSEPAEPIQEA